MKRLIKVLQNPPSVWLMVLQALVLSGWYRWSMLHWSFEKIAPKIGTLQYETPMEPVEEKNIKLIRQVRFAVLGVCNHTPWESKCMIQALTAKKLLNQRGLPCTLYMGVAKDEKGEMIAHAWLRCGDWIVTGGRGHQNFTVTTIFGDKE